MANSLSSGKLPAYSLPTFAKTVYEPHLGFLELMMFAYAFLADYDVPGCSVAAAVPMPGLLSEERFQTNSFRRRDLSCA